MLRAVKLLNFGLPGSMNLLTFSLPKTIACLKSIRRNYPNHPDLFIHYSGADRRVNRFLKSVPNLKRIASIDIPGLSDTIDLGEVDSKTVFDRYIAWGDFFTEYENVLYLDVDTLILRPLDPLLDTDDFLIVDNCEPTEYVRIFHPDKLRDPALLALAEEDGFEHFQGLHDMANAGVFVIPKKLRSRQALEELVALTNRYASYLNYADQSAISLWCHSNKIQISKLYEFNYQITFFKSELSKKLDDIYVLHFSSRRKPDSWQFMKWDRIRRRMRLKLSILFFRYLLF
jgi:lipopolysaccharide biosynthesis glycosyltransferase